MIVSIFHCFRLLQFFPHAVLCSIHLLCGNIWTETCGACVRNKGSQTWNLCCLTLSILTQTALDPIPSPYCQTNYPLWSKNLVFSLRLWPSPRPFCSLFFSFYSTTLHFQWTSCHFQRHLWHSLGTFVIFTSYKEFSRLTQYSVIVILLCEPTRLHNTQFILVLPC